MIQLEVKLYKSCLAASSVLAGTWDGPRAGRGIGSAQPENSMPRIPDDMSPAAIERRAKLTAKMRAEAAKKAAAEPPPAPKPRIAKRR